MELQDFLKVENRRQVPKSSNGLIQRNIPKQKTLGHWKI